MMASLKNEIVSDPSMADAISRTDWRTAYHVANSRRELAKKRGPISAREGYWRGVMDLCHAMHESRRGRNIGGGEDLILVCEGVGDPLDLFVCRRAELLALIGREMWSQSRTPGRNGTQWFHLPEDMDGMFQDIDMIRAADGVTEDDQLNLPRFEPEDEGSDEWRLDPPDPDEG